VSLVSEGFELLGTLKVPALGGKTANNMPLLITAGAYTTAMVGKIKSDAGDLRFTVNSDGTGQLPIDLVTDSIADVWTKLPSVAINNLIYVWGNKPAAVKEIDTATYGKHVVWSDYSLAVHGQYDALDSSGNSTPIFSGSESPVYDSVKGVLVGPEKRIAYSSSLSTSISIVQKLEVTSFTGGLFSNGGNHGFVAFSTRLNGADKSPTLCYSDNGFEGSGFFYDTSGTARGTSDDTIGLTIPHNILQKGTFDRDSSISNYGGTWRVFLDGIKSGENNTPSNAFTTNTYNGQAFSNTVYLGSHPNWPAYAVMYIRDTLLKKFADTEDYSSIEASNQNSTDGWWIATDASTPSGVTVTGSFSLPLTTIESTVTASLPSPVISSSFSFPVLTVSGNQSAVVPQPVISSSFSLPVLTVLGNQSSYLPQPVITSSFTLPSLVTAGNVSVTLPSPELTGAFSFPVVNTSGAINAGLPAPQLSGSFAFPLITVTGNQSAVIPAPVLSASFTLPVLTVTGSQSAGVPTPVLSGSFSLPLFSVLGYVGSAQSSSNINVWGPVNVWGNYPSPTITGSFSLPLVTLTSLITAYVPTPVLSGNVTLPLFSFTGSVNTEVPLPVVTGSFSLPLVTVAGVVTSNVPSPVIEGNITLPVLTTTGLIDVTLPTPVSISGSFSLPNLTTEGFIAVSGVVIVINSNTNINQLYLDNNIDQEYLSNNITYP
jgi:hypothetical protein